MNFDSWISAVEDNLSPEYSVHDLINTTFEDIYMMFLDGLDEKTAAQEILDAED